VRTDRVAITGIGIVSAAGWTPEELWSAIEAERSGLGRLTLFDSPRCGHVPVGQVIGDPAARSGLSRGSRTDHFAVCAARDALEDSGLREPGPAADRRRMGVVLGGTTGGMLSTEAFLQKLLLDEAFDAALLRDHQCCAATEAVAAGLQLRGFRATVSDACASSNAAVAIGCDVLRSGEADVMLAGGADSLTRLTLNGFCSLLNVSHEGARPFDAERSGLSLGEGAGMLVLEREEAAVARGARIYGLVAGYGSTCDANHLTAPMPDGSAAANAMRRALEMAGIAPAAVDYVNAHGTGTVTNDLAEARALRAVFGSRPPAVSSTKRFFGHTLGAAGAMEAVVCVLAMQRQRFPANLGFRTMDAEVGFAPVAHTCDGTIRAIVTNSFGFGGNNCSLVICGREA